MAAVDPAPYTGPSARHMIETHTLAREIINRNDDACPVLDADELALLSRFVADPPCAAALLEARGQPAGPPGSLVAHVISLHGSDKAALTDDEIGLLKEWFESGQNTKE